MKRNHLIAIGIVAGTILIAYSLYLDYNRYYTMIASKGIAYEVDKKTGKTWVLKGVRKILQKDFSSTKPLSNLPLDARSTQMANRFNIGISVVLALFAGATVLLASKQNKLNKTMLKLEAYSRRLQIYDAMKEFVGETIAFGSSGCKKAIELLIETRHAKFLFDEDDDIGGYIDLFYKNAHDMEYQDKAINGKLEKIEEKKREEIIKKNDELFKWFQNQRDVIDQKFKKYLQLK